MSDASKKLANGLTQLKAKFISNIPSRLDQFESALKIVKKKGAPAVEDLEYLAHTLKGTAASFGLREISEAARDLEVSAKEILINADKMISASQAAKLRSQYKYLKKCCLSV